MRHVYWNSKEEKNWRREISQGAATHFTMAALYLRALKAGNAGVLYTQRTSAESRRILWREALPKQFVGPALPIDHRYVTNNLQVVRFDSENQ